VQNFEMITQ